MPKTPAKRAAKKPVPQAPPPRKGYMRISDIPASLRRDLNHGRTESRTLAECLSVDFAQLMKHAVPDVHPRTIRAMQAAAETGWVGRTKLAGVLLLDDLGPGIFPHLLAHASDQVRGWGAALLAARADLTLQKRLTLVRPLADDANAGVRETAWLMLRPHVAEDVPGALRLLQPWTQSDSANIRRYASEITRPRGVWCAHIPLLRQKPEKAAALLQALRADPSRYVQNAVGNWLNDAAKDRPDWVLSVVKKWQAKNAPRETLYICRRGMRSLKI